MSIDHMWQWLVLCVSVSGVLQWFFMGFAFGFAFELGRCVVNWRNSGKSNS